MTAALVVFRHIIVGLAAAAAICVPIWAMTSALGGRFGFWEPLEGFRHVLTYAGLPGFGRGFLLPATLGLGVVALAFVIIQRVVQGAKNSAGPGGYVAGVMAILVGGAPMAMIVLNAGQTASIPPIHDITTDTQNPPQFTAGMIERRGSESNSVVYEEKIDPRSERSLPIVQAEAYPEIESLVVSADPNTVYRAALDVGRDMGWMIATASETELSFEATDTTFWFGFKDDVVVRLSETAENGTRVDVRSVSRVGMSDLGANAARIEAFLADLEAALAG